MRCSISRVHELILATHRGDSGAGVDLCSCFSDEIQRHTVQFPATVRNEIEQQTCIRLLTEIAKKFA